MPDDAPQTEPAPTAQDTPPEPEPTAQADPPAPAPDAAPVPDAPAPPVPAPAPAPVPTLSDLLSNDDAWAQLEDMPEFRQRVGDKANAQAQEQVQRADVAAHDRATIVATMERTLIDAGLPADQVTDELRQRLGLMSDLNRQNETDVLAQDLRTLMLEVEKVPVDVFAAAERQLKVPVNNGGGWPGYFTTLLSGAAQQRVGDIRLTDVPEGSALHKDIKAEVARLHEVEVAAIQQQQQRAETPGVPDAPNGQTTGLFTRAEMIGGSREFHAKNKDTERYKASHKALIENRI